MRKIFMFFILISLIGCTEKIRSYVDEPQTLLRDPHFAEYNEKAKALERTYLDGSITYAVYLEKKKELDEQYEKEVKSRESAMHGEIEERPMERALEKDY